MQKLIQNLEEKKDNTSFTNIIDFIRKCEKIGASLNPQQKHYMVQRLKENSEEILTFFFKFSFMFDPTNGISPLKYKSAFKIILDDYKAFPTDKEGTAKVNRIQQLLDKATELWNEYIEDQIYFQLN